MKPSKIGKALAGDLQLIGIDHPKKLIGKEPFELYEALCATSGKKHDPCVIDVFMSVIRRPLNPLIFCRKYPCSL